MVAIVGLAFNSSVFAGPPDHAKGDKGVEMKNANASDKAKDKANENAGFTTGEDNVPPADEPVCTAYWNGVCVSWE